MLSGKLHRSENRCVHNANFVVQFVPEIMNLQSKLTHLLIKNVLWTGSLVKKMLIYDESEIYPH